MSGSINLYMPYTSLGSLVIGVAVAPIFIVALLKLYNALLLSVEGVFA